MKVPAKAKVRMVPMLRKKLPYTTLLDGTTLTCYKREAYTWCNSYPAAKMIGGSNRLKKNW